MQELRWLPTRKPLAYRESTCTNLSAVLLPKQIIFSAAIAGYNAGDTKQPSADHRELPRSSWTYVKQTVRLRGERDEEARAPVCVCMYVHAYT